MGPVLENGPHKDRAWSAAWMKFACRAFVFEQETTPPRIRLNHSPQTYPWWSQQRIARIADAGKGRRSQTPLDTLLWTHQTPKHEGKNLSFAGKGRRGKHLGPVIQRLLLQRNWLIAKDISDRAPNTSRASSSGRIYRHMHPPKSKSANQAQN